MKRVGVRAKVSIKLGEGEGDEDEIFEYVGGGREGDKTSNI